DSRCAKLRSPRDLGTFGHPQTRSCRAVPRASSDIPLAATQDAAIARRMDARPALTPMSPPGGAVHVDELIAAKREADVGAARRLRRHLVPRHRRGIEHVAFHGMEFAGGRELPADLTHLDDPPFRRPWMHVTEGAGRIEGRRARGDGAAADIAGA